MAETITKKCKCGADRAPKLQMCTFCWTSYYRERRFGISKEQFVQMFEDQQGECGICHKEISYGSCLDHDHKTGRIRGILCSSCNKGLGQLGDNIQGMLNALIYLAEERTV